MIFERMHPNARPMNGVITRIFSALARPYQTSYVCPVLMTITGVVYALRGYDVYWSPVRFDTKEWSRDPSTLCYRIYKQDRSERYPSHGIEVRSFFPRWMILTECWIRNNWYKVKRPLRFLNN